MEQDTICGCILGTAIGDALGLPYEKVPPRRAAKLLGAPDRYRFIFGRGMVSDDTEHTCIVAQSLIESAFEPSAFQRSLARRLRYWMLGFPTGAGSATLRAIIRLWIGVSPNRSGVYSAGNGPAMRAAILGVTIDDVERLRAFVHLSTIITHTDPKAEYGAMAVALAANMASKKINVSPEDYLALLEQSLGAEGAELVKLLEQAAKSASAGDNTAEFADSLGLSKGVSGYMYHTVPVVLHAWFAHPEDYRAGITSVIRCGGDADTTAAILGGILGARIGQQGIPMEWISGLCEPQRTTAWMIQLSNQLYQTINTKAALRPKHISVVPQLFRNALFLQVVLYHGCRRLLPPY